MVDVGTVPVWVRCRSGYGAGLASGDYPATSPAEELRGWAWCTGAQAAGRLSGLLARRMAAAVRARADGTAPYLEDGYPVT